MCSQFQILTLSFCMCLYACRCTEITHKTCSHESSMRAASFWKKHSSLHGCTEFYRTEQVYMAGAASDGSGTPHSEVMLALTSADFAHGELQSI